MTLTSSKRRNRPLFFSIFLIMDKKKEKDKKKKKAPVSNKDPYQDGRKKSKLRPVQKGKYKAIDFSELEEDLSF